MMELLTWYAAFIGTVALLFASWNFFDFRRWRKKQRLTEK